jgi:hypothetical protein
MSGARLARLLLAGALSLTPLSAQQDATFPSPESSDKPRIVTGRAIDDITGDPISGATVRLSVATMHMECPNCGPVPPPSRPASARERITGSDGRFVFESVPAANVSIQAGQPGFLDVWAFRRHANDPLGMYQPADQTGPIAIRLAPAASISGIVRDRKGVAITKDPRVTLWRLTAWDGWPYLDFGAFPDFDANGTYHFHDLLPGRYALVSDDQVNVTAPANELGYISGAPAGRYPKPTDQPNPFFVLQEGQHAHINVRFSQSELHLASLVQKEPEPNVAAASSNLPYGRVQVPIEVSSPAPDDSICVQDSPPACALWFVRFIRFLPSGYVAAGGDSTQTGKVEGTPPRRVESISVLPGRFTVEVYVFGNIYARSVTSGATDLSVEPLVVPPGATAEPIHITLAEGAAVAGVVNSNGRPVRAFVYAVPDDIEFKSDFRGFQPVTSEVDGKFRIEGLAPRPYILFASPIELAINIHDPAELAYWRSAGKILSLQGRKTTEVVLSPTDPPELR